MKRLSWSQAEGRNKQNAGQSQTYNDGHCAIYAVTNVAERGKLPAPSLSVKYAYLRYAKRVVGIERFWSAKQNNVAVDMVARLPLVDISTQDLFIAEDGNQYEIMQIQRITEATPQYMDLSLQRRIDAYDVGRISEPDIDLAPGD